MMVICIILIFGAYHESTFNKNPNSISGRICNAIWPLFGALILICESAFNKLLFELDDSKHIDDSDF